MTEASADTYIQNTFGSTYPELVNIYLGLSGSFMHYPFSNWFSFILYFTCLMYPCLSSKYLAILSENKLLV